MLFCCLKSSITKWKSQQHVTGYIRAENVAATKEMEDEGIKKDEKHKKLGQVLNM